MKRISAIIFPLLMLIPCLAQENPVKTASVRELMDLSGQWSFKADPDNEGEYAGWYRAETDKTFWPLVNVPIAFDNCGPGLERYFGTGWFCRSVFVPESFKGRRIVLHFEGINYNAKVWINGKPAGENHDAFLPFDIPVSDFLKTGEENNIALSVNNIRQRGQFPLFEGWYGQGGFMRESSLVATSYAYIEGTVINAVPEEGGKDSGGKLSVHVAVKNETKSTLPFKIKAIVRDKTGKMVATLFSPVNTLNPGQRDDLMVTGYVSGVRWWSPGSPVLYAVEISLLHEEKVFDTQIRMTGFRKIEVRDAGIFVNGKQLFLQGFNRHEDSPRTGMAVDLQQAREDFTRMKKAGCNYVRFCHYPHHPGELDLCDELGLFVLAENAMNEWGHIDHPAPNPAIPLEPDDAPLVIENARRTLIKMVDRDNHHPSIIIWSVSNENEESREDVSKGNDLLIQFGKTLDGSRPWTHVSNSFRKAGWENFYRFDDVIVVNVYPTHWYKPSAAELDAGLPGSTRIMQDTLKRLHERFPEKPIIVGEFGFPDGDAGEKGARIQSIATEAEFKGLTAPYIAGCGLWCYARHPWPWNNVSNYGYVSRDRMSVFPAFLVVKRLYLEHAVESSK